MPGHILNAVCPCGFNQMVHPGSAVWGQESIIAYDPGKPELLTIDREETQAKRLAVIRNPYLDHIRHSMWEENLQRQAQECIANQNQVTCGSGLCLRELENRAMGC